LTGRSDQIDFPKLFSALNSTGQPDPKDILSLSDRYINHTGSPDIWSKVQWQNAYLQYFMPLNILRIQAVLHQLQSTDFLTGVNSILELGSGPGTAQVAWPKPWPTWQAVEAHAEARKLHLKVLSALTSSANAVVHETHVKPGADLFLATFVGNELGGSQNLSEECTKFPAVLVVEPGTKKDFSNLLRLRETLLHAGYSVWAPCIHQAACPFTQTPNDWCHFHAPRPKEWHWFMEIEDRLPIKNRTVSFSYLAAKRQTPEPVLHHARTIGATRREKGKTRQRVCRNSKKEYLSWLSKDGPAPEVPSGDLIEIPKTAIIKGEEIRLHPRDHQGS
jgi:hypothetical protein